MDSIAPEEPVDRETLATALFKSLDVDADGCLTAEEFTAMATCDEQRDEMGAYYKKLGLTFDGRHKRSRHRCLAMRLRMP